MPEYRNPTPTVDVIIEVEGGIVLIERKNTPHGWALPGGFVDEGEGVAAAARREALEETGLEVTLTEQFFCYSDPARDPRKHTISVVYLGHASGRPEAADDAARAEIFQPDRLPSPLAFDHGQILQDYVEYRSSGRRPPVAR